MNCSESEDSDVYLTYRHKPLRTVNVLVLKTEIRDDGGLRHQWYTTDGLFLGSSFNIVRRELRERRIEAKPTLARLMRVTAYGKLRTADDREFLSLCKWLEHFETDVKNSKR